MNVNSFEEIEKEFMRRAQQAVYCNVATVDLKNRPRTRIMHVVWDGPIGWVITWPASHKAKHLANNPHVSLAYIAESTKPAYEECIPEWVDTVEEKLRIRDLHKTIPPPLGFDPTPGYGAIENQHYGLLRFTPWRIELAELKAENLTWRPGLAKE